MNGTIYLLICTLLFGTCFNIGTSEDLKHTHNGNHVAKSGGHKKSDDGLIMIDDDEDHGANLITGSGSYDDEDGESGSGSDEDDTEGSAAYEQTTIGVKLATTRLSRMTACQTLFASGSNSSAMNYIPQCTESGEFKKRQCEGHGKHESCWCVDSQGNLITGTHKRHPEKPDCEAGSNLPSCIYLLVQHSRGILGEFKPRCLASGDFDSQQCHEAMCWCVDKYGRKIEKTETFTPRKLNCKDPYTIVIEPSVEPEPERETTTRHHHHHPEEKDSSSEIGEETDPIDIDGSIEVTGEPEVTKSYENLEETTNQAIKTPITQKPGLLAAIVGGAVVGLLCAILLVMFIVYRMRKKDEGSYPLDEPRPRNYPYTKAPDKEFYA